MPRHLPKQLTQIERDFELHLQQQGKAPVTIQNYGKTVHRFMRYVGDRRLYRLTDEQVKSLFQEAFGSAKKAHQLSASVAIREFLQFAAARLSAAVVVSGRESAKPAPVQDAREIALRQQWSFDLLLLEKERADDLIAVLGRQLVNCYLFFQSRLIGTPENLDDIIRMADECREVIERNLPLFLKLSALGEKPWT